jgi:predicted DNA-binding protein (MmcQ/YjbR family)
MQMAKLRVKDEHWDTALENLRAVCGGLPEVSETLSYGNPAFKVGRKTFAVLDVYRGASCIWLACGPERRAELLGREGFFPAPYDRAGVAVCRTAEGVDWPAFAELVRETYAYAL